MPSEAGKPGQLKRSGRCPGQGEDNPNRKGVAGSGVKIYSGYTQIQEEKIEGFKEKERQIARRNSPVNLKKVIEDLNPALRGFANYFWIANYRGVLRSRMEWIRRRLRAKQLALWKKPKRLYRLLRQLGHRGEFLKIKMRSWRNAASPLACQALKNHHLEEMGLYDRTRVETGISVLG